MPITGTPTRIAWSMILQIFSACASESAPPKTVKSWREDEDRAAVDRAVAGDHAVAGHRLAAHVEVGAAVLDEHVPLLEAALVEQQLDALAGGELALGVVCVDALAPPAEPGGGTLVLELLQNLLHRGIVSSLNENWDIFIFKKISEQRGRS